MKPYFTIIFSMAVFACETKTETNHKGVSLDQSSEIKVSIDTLSLPINGDLTNVAWFRNNFYAIFETRRKNTTELFKKMIVFSKNGEIIEDVFLPKEIQDMVNCDLIVSNDSLYIKETEMKKRTSF